MGSLLKATAISRIVHARDKAHPLLNNALLSDAMGKKECATRCVKHLRLQVRVCGSKSAGRTRPKAEVLTRRPVNYFVGAFEQVLVARYAVAIRSGMPRHHYTWTTVICPYNISALYASYFSSYRFCLE